MPEAESTRDEEHQSGGWRRYLRQLGPGVISGAANDDPGAIGTHAQIGAQFGNAGFWLAPYTLPITAVVLEMSAQIGNVSGRGLITILRFHYSKSVLWSAVVALTIANIVNLAADLGIMASAVEMLIGGRASIWLALLALMTGTLQVFVPYAPYARILKYLALALFSYVIAVVLVPHDWSTVVHRTFIPTVQWNEAFLLAAVAVIGTRLSPYVLFWQPAQVVEEQIGEGRERLIERVGATKDEVRSTQVDVISGCIVANIVTWAIMVTTASTLHEQGITNVTTATQAADALKPAAGTLAYGIFALGILATGLLAVPVLAGGIGYAMGEALGWKRGLAREAGEAKKFYAVIVASIIARCCSTSSGSIRSARSSSVRY